MLTQAIRRGDLPDWQALPSERDLAARFGCSRHAVREVFNELEDDGLILRRRGRNGGTLVRPRRLHRDLQTLQSLPVTLSEQGMTAVTTVLRASVRRPSARAQEALRLSAGERVVEIVRLRTVAGKSLSLERACFPAALTPGLETDQLTGSLYSLLSSKYQLDIVSAVEEVTAINADPDDAAGLDVPPGTALLQITRIGRDADAVPAEFSRDVFVGSEVLATTVITSRTTDW